MIIKPYYKWPKLSKLKIGNIIYFYNSDIPYTILEVNSKKIKIRINNDAKTFVHYSWFKIENDIIDDN